MANLAPTQVEQLHAIGAYLRQMRQEQGLSVDLLASQIFIRPALLQAIEEGREGELPEPVFIQGFIRRYAEALGLDGQALAQEFVVTPMNVLLTPRSAEPASANGAVQPPPPPPVQQSETVPPPARRAATGKSWLPLLVALGALALALGLVFWGLFGRRNNVPTTTDSVTPTEVTPDPVASETPVSSETAGDDPAEAAGASDEPLEPIDASANASLEAPIVVDASLSERAWLSVVADGETVYEGTPEPGFEETWTAENTLVFTTGNAGGVELAINGDDAVVVGDVGVVRTINLTPASGAESIESP
ncbi:MAG: helix-turn-helix domain-containing protein [Nodosilinea sp.]